MTGPDRFFVRMCRFLVGTALAGVVLAGCTPADSGGGTPAGGCDPHGFGPFSGCGTSSTERAAEPVSGSCDPSGFGPLSGCHGDQGATSGPGDAPGDTATAEDMAQSAEHEAWHREVGRCYGWHVVSSELYPDGDGLTTVDVPVGAPLRQRLALLVAGAVADGTDEYSLDDLEQADTAMRDAGVPPADRDRLLSEARAEAARCAATQTAQIGRDAAQLLKDGSLR